MASRAIVLQQKTQRPVQFEITEPTRDAVGAWIGHAELTSESSLFPRRLHASVHLSTRQYARIVDSWVRLLGLGKAWAATQRSLPGKLTRNGYHLVFWKAGDLQYCAVSDAGWDELLGLVRLLQDLGGRDAG
jgi:hypothetical protein